MECGAEFSQDRRYRYTLWREWDAGEAHLNVIGLNPSTADERDDDQTVRRCVYYARRWGFGGLRVTNLYAFRSTRPERMRAAQEPVGLENDRWLCEVAAAAGSVVVAWAADVMVARREGAVLELLRGLPLQCLAHTRTGRPRHPLYLSNDVVPAPYCVPGC